MIEEEMQVPLDWRAEINPWTPDAPLARTLILRASILWSYSNVEQLLMDIIVRCAREEEYYDLRDTPPFTNKQRLKFIEDVLKSPGPLAHFAPLGLAIVERYKAEQSIRNRMAHSRLEVLSNDHIVFKEIVVSGTEIHEIRTPYYPGHLERLARRASRFSKACQRIHYKMVGDEPLSGG